MGRFQLCTARVARLAPALWLLGAAAGAAGAAELDFTALLAPPVRREAVTTALQALWEMAPPAAAGEAEKLRARRTDEAREARLAASMLYGAATERAGKLPAAAAAYRAVVAAGPATPYAISARARLRHLKHRRQLEELELQLLREPATESWFLAGDRWQWTDSRRAASAALLSVRSDRLSMRLLAYLHSKSWFPPPYAYLFIFLALGLGVKLVALPLHVQSTRLQVQIGRLRPEFEMLQTLHRGEPVRFQQELAALWQRHGLKPWGGCAVGLVDLIFVIWALKTLAAYAPQLALDGARFAWVSDLSRPSLGILLLWLGLSLVQGILAAVQQPGKRGQMVATALLSGLLFMGIAWYWDWPPYVLIFWGLLILLGLLLNLILRPICAATTA